MVIRHILGVMHVTHAESHGRYFVVRLSARRTVFGVWLWQVWQAGLSRGGFITRGLARGFGSAH